MFLVAIAPLVATCLATPQGTGVTQEPSVRMMFDADSLLAPDALTRIAAMQPAVAVKYQGRAAKSVVTDAQAPEAEAVRGALIGIVRCDDAYKLFVTPDLLQGIERNESFIRLTFSTALTLKGASGAVPTSVRSMLVPLTGRWTQGGQAFFYEDAERSWSALRWSAPDSSTWQRVLTSVAKMVR